MTSLFPHVNKQNLNPIDVGETKMLHNKIEEQDNKDRGPRSQHLSLLGVNTKWGKTSRSQHLMLAGVNTKPLK